MPKIVDRKEMRADLMRGCFGLFARKGFSAVTMRDLAAELEVSTGTLYHYFTSKTDLFHQMLRHLVESDVREALDRVKDATQPLARAQVLLEYIAEKEEHFKNLLFLLFDLKRQPPGESRDALREMLQAYRQGITKNMGFSDDLLGNMVMSVVVGTLVQRVIDPDGTPLDEVRDYIAAALIGRAAGAATV